MWPNPGKPYLGTFVKTLVEGLRAYGGVHDVLLVPAHESPFNYITIIPTLLSTLKKGNYDLVHAQFAHCALIAGLFSKVPVVAHYHGEFDYRSTEQYRLTAHVLDRRKDSLLAILSSKLVKAAVVVNKEDYDRISRRFKAVIPIGVDEDAFTPIPRPQACSALSWDPSVKRVLFPSSPGRPEKNYYLFKRVLSILGNSGTRIEEVILQGVPHSRVPIYLSAVDVMLLTSRTEASATVIREATACNLPVVACPVGDATLQLAGVSPGGVFASEPQALADAVKHVLSSGQRSNGREKALETWGLRKTVKSMMDFYERVLRDS
jgi:glycosyltransferase involved in cell wall biosynthesis